MAKEIPLCTAHAVCLKDTGPVTDADVEQILACLKERGIVEVVPGTEAAPRYRKTKEYRD